MIDRITVVCLEHDTPALVASMEYHPSSSLWFLVPSSRESRHSSVPAEAEGVHGRYRLICGRCRAERRDKPLTIKSATITKRVEQRSAENLTTDARGYTVLDRTMLR